MLDLFEEAIYALCAVTALARAGLLWRGFRVSGVRLLLWGSLCFAGLTITNVLLFVDKVIVDHDLTTERYLIGFLSFVVFLGGLIVDSR